MHIDLDPILQTAQPWDLQITAGHVTHRVRRLTNVDVKRLSDAAKFNDDENRTFVAGLFEAAPPVNDWSAEVFTTVLSAIMAYYTQVVLRKNADMVTELVTRQLTSSKAASGSGA